MKTKKQQTIEAIEFLIKERYIKGRKYGTTSYPLCDMHLNLTIIGRCPGCPNNIFKGKKHARCLNSKTYGHFQKRRKFWQQALPILETLPDKAFTIKGYKDEYFRFLIDIDNKIANGN